MEINRVNEALEVVTAIPSRKLVYKTPLMRVYGGVHQFTQGSGSAQQDANVGMLMTQSDRACKTNLARVGTHPLNIGLYLFDYKPEFQASAGFGRHFGVMADEVETVMSEAVVMHVDGFKRVSYAMLGIDLSGRGVH